MSPELCCPNTLRYDLLCISLQWFRAAILKFVGA